MEIDEALPDNNITIDSSQHRTFVKFFKSLEEKSPSTIQFFCRGEFYTLHGPDAIFAAKEVFKSTSVLKSMNTPDSKNEKQLHYVCLSKLNFEAFVRDLLLVKGYRVEVYMPEKDTNEWKLEYKGSPGNLIQFEDLLFGEDSLINRTESVSGVIAVRLTDDGKNKMVGIGYIDAGNNTMIVSEFADSDSLANLEATIIQLGPREILLAAGGLKGEQELIKEVAERCRLLISERKRTDFNADEGFIQDLGRLLKIENDEVDYIKALPELNLENASSCLAACIRFLELINDSSNFGKFKLEKYDSDRFVRIDGTTIRAVYVKPMSVIDGIGPPTESLLGLLGQNVKTQQGLRLLSRWLQQPLRDKARLEERLNVVSALSEDYLAMESLSKGFLSAAPDFRTFARKFHKQKATLSDLYKISQGIQRLSGVIETLEGLDVSGEIEASLKALLLDPLREFHNDMSGFVKMVNSTIDAENVLEGIYRVKSTFDERLVELQELMDDLKNKLQRCLEKAADELDLDVGKTIKLENNSQYGHFFRITLKEEPKLRGNKNYETLDARQGGVKFTNKKVRVLSEDYIGASTEYEEQQKVVVSEIMKIANGYVDTLYKLSDVIAHVDVLNSFAITAKTSKNIYVRPIIHPTGTGIIKFKQLRHPCLERVETLEYIPNDVECDKEQQRMIILTGPNMGGKSTYIRSIGAVMILAQIGSFVPADFAEVSLVDAVLARIGAGDCQIHGVSTFMAEMLESAAIVRAGTENSLIIIDELGRGTSTYDGCGLAWSIAHHIAENMKSFCLFATHFHELTTLDKAINGVVNYHVVAETSGDNFMLLYKVEKGACDKSFGIHIARMLDFPEEILKAAEIQQKELEFQHQFLTSGKNDDEIKNRKEGETIINEFLTTIENVEEDKLSNDELMKTLETLRNSVLNKNNTFVDDLLTEKYLNYISNDTNADEKMECE